MMMSIIFAYMVVGFFTYLCVILYNYFYHGIRYNTEDVESFLLYGILWPLTWFILSLELYETLILKEKEDDDHES